MLSDARYHALPENCDAVMTSEFIGNARDTYWRLVIGSSALKSVSFCLHFVLIYLQ
jgi:hypothetical protein